MRDTRDRGTRGDEGQRDTRDTMSMQVTPPERAEEERAEEAGPWWRGWPVARGSPPRPHPRRTGCCSGWMRLKPARGGGHVGHLPQAHTKATAATDRVDGGHRMLRMDGLALRPLGAGPNRWAARRFEKGSAPDAEEWSQVPRAGAPAGPLQKGRVGERSARP